jgi:hypothetical protein
VVLELALDGKMNGSVVFLEVNQAFELPRWLNVNFKGDDYNLEPQ